MKKYLLPLLAALALLAGCNDQDTAEKKAAVVPEKPGSQFIGSWCRRAFKFDHLCALNFDQG